MALNENVVREQNARIGELVRTPSFLVAAGSLTGLAAATSVANGIAIGAVSAIAIVVMAVLARPLRSITGIWARIPVLLMVSATVVTLLSFAVRIIDPLVYQNLGIYLPLAAVNGLVAFFIYDDAFTARPATGFTVGTAVFGAVCTFLALTFVGFINGMFATGEVFGLVNRELAASPIAIFGTPAGSLLVLALVCTFVNSIVDAARKSAELRAANTADAAGDSAAKGGERA